MPEFSAVTHDGEWEAWFFANWLPGATRFRSFAELMEAEYQSFHERDTLSEATATSPTDMSRTAILSPELERVIVNAGPGA